MRVCKTNSQHESLHECECGVTPHHCLPLGDYTYPLKHLLHFYHFLYFFLSLRSPHSTAQNPINSSEGQDFYSIKFLYFKKEVGGCKYNCLTGQKSRCRVSSSKFCSFLNVRMSEEKPTVSVHPDSYAALEATVLTLIPSLHVHYTRHVVLAGVGNVTTNTPLEETTTSIARRNSVMTTRGAITTYTT